MKDAIYSVQMVEGMGRGVIAERDIKLGEIITNCELLVLNRRDTRMVNETSLEYYTFVYDRDESLDCLVLGDGEIFNHSDEANTLYGLIDFDGRKLMRFQAARDIKKGEQLFIDYNADTAINSGDYISAKSLISA
jgi:SET domain-containing protein